MLRLPSDIAGLLRGLHRRTSRFRPWLAPIELLSGTSRTTGRPLRVLLANPGAAGRSFCLRLFAEPVEAKTVGRLIWPDRKGRLERLLADADLVVARLGRSVARTGDGDPWLRVPESVGARLSVGAPGTTLARANATGRRNIRLIERNGLFWSVSHEPAAFARFYERMYLPFARARYGDDAFVRRRWVLERSFRQGGLLEIRREGSVVAAQLFRVERDVMTLLGPGTLDGSDAPVRLGALSALYVFAAAYAEERGLRWIDLGASLPSLRDGVLLHKRSWGASLFDRPESPFDLWFGWRTWQEDIRTLLLSAPLVIRDDAGLSGLAAVAPEDAHAPERVGAKLTMEGLRRVVVVADRLERPAPDVTLVPPCSSRELGRLLVDGDGNGADASQIPALGGPPRRPSMPKARA